ncbi:hypothetical protein Sango_1403100 [Sesamum angolense]|uniref:Uncharacterized protein n=1 Tax=Sesamum angolense TaxID=2727404 RepID=A0AAE2BVF7_9LAMI|nr:hypothetical protein Sango_1403100 [Sesamum angolense]
MPEKIGRTKVRVFSSGPEVAHVMPVAFIQESGPYISQKIRTSEWKLSSIRSVTSNKLRHSRPYSSNTRFPNGKLVFHPERTRFLSIYPNEAYSLCTVIFLAEDRAKVPDIPPLKSAQAREILSRFCLTLVLGMTMGIQPNKGKERVGLEDREVGISRRWNCRISLFFIQNPGTAQLGGQMETSIDLGTEIYKDPNQVAEWTATRRKFDSEN